MLCERSHCRTDTRLHFSDSHTGSLHNHVPLMGLCCCPGPSDALGLMGSLVLVEASKLRCTWSACLAAQLPALLRTCIPAQSPQSLCARATLTMSAALPAQWRGFLQATGGKGRDDHGCCRPQHDPAAAAQGHRPQLRPQLAVRPGLLRFPHKSCCGFQGVI